MKLSRMSRIGLLGATFVVALLGFGRAGAEVTVGFDVKTLNAVLPAMTKTTIQVPLTQSRSVDVQLTELRIDGFAPSAEPDGNGHILTHLEVKVPQFGLTVTLKPHLSLNVVEESKERTLELRFERARLPLPVGTLDISRFLPPIKFPADSLYSLDGLRDDLLIHSRLSGVKMGREILRFEFDVGVIPAPGRGR